MTLTLLIKRSTLATENVTFVTALAKDSGDSFDGKCRSCTVVMGAGAAELRSSEAVIEWKERVCHDWESGFQWRGGKGGST